MTQPWKLDVFKFICCFTNTDSQSIIQLSNVSFWWQLRLFFYYSCFKKNKMSSILYKGWKSFKEWTEGTGETTLLIQMYPSADFEVTRLCTLSDMLSYSITYCKINIHNSKSKEKSMFIFFMGHTFLFLIFLPVQNLFCKKKL